MSFYSFTFPDRTLQLYIPLEVQAIKHSKELYQAIEYLVEKGYFWQEPNHFEEKEKFTYLYKEGFRGEKELKKLEVEQLMGLTLIFPNKKINKWILFYFWIYLNNKTNYESIEHLDSKFLYYNKKEERTLIIQNELFGISYLLERNQWKQFLKNDRYWNISGDHYLFSHSSGSEYTLTKKSMKCLLEKIQEVKQKEKEGDLELILLKDFFVEYFEEFPEEEEKEEEELKTQGVQPSLSFNADQAAFSLISLGTPTSILQEEEKEEEEEKIELVSSFEFKGEEILLYLPSEFESYPSKKLNASEVLQYLYKKEYLTKDCYTYFYNRKFRGASKNKKAEEEEEDPINQREKEYENILDYFSIHSTFDYYIFFYFYIVLMKKDSYESIEHMIQTRKEQLQKPRVFLLFTDIGFVNELIFISYLFENEPFWTYMMKNLNYWYEKNSVHLFATESMKCKLSKLDKFVDKVMDEIEKAKKRTKNRKISMEYWSLKFYCLLELARKQSGGRNPEEKEIENDSESEDNSEASSEEEKEEEKKELIQLSNLVSSEQKEEKIYHSFSSEHGSVLLYIPSEFKQFKGNSQKTNPLDYLKQENYITSKLLNHKPNIYAFFEWYFYIYFYDIKEYKNMEQKLEIKGFPPSRSKQFIDNLQIVSSLLENDQWKYLIENEHYWHNENKNGLFFNLSSEKLVPSKISCVLDLLITLIEEIKKKKKEFPVNIISFLENYFKYHLSLNSFYQENYLETSSISKEEKSKRMDKMNRMFLNSFLDSEVKKLKKRNLEEEQEKEKEEGENNNKRMKTN